MNLAMMRLAPSLTTLLLVVLPGFPPAAPGGTPTKQEVEPVASPADDVHIRIGRATLERLLRAAVPYEVRIRAGLFDEVVELTEPREVRFVPGGVRLKMTASGRPLAFSAVVAPEIRIAEDSGGFMVQIQKMPVTIGAAGTYDLASFIRPVPIEKVSRHFIETPGRSIGMDLVVSAIEVTDDGLSVRFGTRFN